MSGQRLLRCLGLLLLNVTALSAVAEAPFSFATTPGKLPKTVVPRHYDIHLQPDQETFTTHGSVMVDLEVREPILEIVLNALELKITKATLLAGKEIPLTPVPDETNQTVALRLPAEPVAGNCQLALEFDGRIGEQAQGLFYVKYASPSGKKVMLGTQMEPTDARRVFPCWDEPAFRATFDLTVVMPKKLAAVSNMPIERETSMRDGLKAVKFARTPAMASYLVVFACGEFEELKGRAEGVDIRVITTQGKRKQGRYALDAAEELLSYYNQYFGLKYPLPKLDLIAIPGGFEGAMENWGGITFNESVLLFDPKSSSEETRRNIFITVAHEMSHQWFGNLVTMAWWDNLWLNEGFATWMETKATDHFNPGWETWLAAATEKSAVMSGDARGATHPIQCPITSETQANDAFDSITYQKGGALLRMLESYLGEKTFRRGIQEYLAAHSYSSTTTADLWAALGAVSGKPVQAISAHWTEQPGLPVVSIRSECVNGRETVTLEQERLVVQDPTAGPQQWQIPVALMDAAHPGNVTVPLLEGKSTTLPIGACDSIVKANAGDTGYYRVAYEPALFGKLQTVFNRLPTADRLNLLNDAWAMAEANRLPMTAYFELLESVHGEKSPMVWQQILSTLGFIDELEQHQPGRERFREYARGLLQPQLQRLGGMGPARGHVADAPLRGRIIASLGDMGDAAVIKQAQLLFREFLGKPNSLDPDLRPSVLKIVGRYSDAKTYEQLHKLALNAKGTEERELYYEALSAALDPELAKATLALSLAKETVPQEASRLVIDVATSSEQQELAWEFAQKHMPELLPLVDSFERNHYLPSIFASFSDSARANELEAYMKTAFPEDALEKAKEAAAAIRLKSALKQRELPVLDRWIANHPPKITNSKS